MRITKIGNNSYAKNLDQKEVEVTDVLNRYFRSDLVQGGTNESKQAIVNEILKMIKPLAISIIEATVERKIDEYIREEIKNKITQEIDNILSNIDLEQYFRSEINDD
jgi:uncharacterized membrane protein YheB (UPF0754 family)